jgi:SAM-dependent methyltransferase
VSLVEARPLVPRVAYDRVAETYHEWRWYRFWRTNEAPLVVQWLRALARGRGLDAGSGTGPYLPFAATLGHRCVAVDISLEMLKRQEAGGASWPGQARVQADIRTLPFSAETFDWILCTRTLSHLPSIGKTIAELGRVLRIGGQCLITDVHPEHSYEHVTIPHRGIPVAIETYKHALADVRSQGDAHALTLETLSEHRLADLVEPPSRMDFGKLYQHPEDPIFYVARFVKRAARRSARADPERATHG